MRLAENALYREDAEVFVRAIGTNVIHRVSLGERIGDQSVAGFEPDAGLEVGLTNGAHHRERNVRAIEHTSVIRIRATVSNCDVVVSCIRVDVHLDPAIENTSEGVTCVIDLEVGAQSGSVVEGT